MQCTVVWCSASAQVQCKCMSTVHSGKVQCKCMITVHGALQHSAECWDLEVPPSWSQAVTSSPGQGSPPGLGSPPGQGSPPARQTFHNLMDTFSFLPK